MEPQEKVDIRKLARQLVNNMPDLTLLVSMLDEMGDSRRFALSQDIERLIKRREKQMNKIKLINPKKS